MKSEDFKRRGEASREKSGKINQSKLSLYKNTIRKSLNLNVN